MRQHPERENSDDAAGFYLSHILWCLFIAYHVMSVSFISSNRAFTEATGFWALLAWCAPLCYAKIPDHSSTCGAIAWWFVGATMILVCHPYMWLYVSRDKLDEKLVASLWWTLGSCVIPLGPAALMKWCKRRAVHHID